MKLTNTQLRRIIKEELGNVMNEMEMGMDMGGNNAGPPMGGVQAPEAQDPLTLINNLAQESGSIDTAMLLQNGIAPETLDALEAAGKIAIDRYAPDDYDVEGNMVTIIGTDQVSQF